MNRVCCILCRRSEETEVTGALSTKQEVTAHQNCLLFSSGIFCENSPEYDDLFGFAVKKVLEEYQRGRKLTCRHCKRSGATAGCEIRKCKKSFHYPCAFERGAKIVEDHEEGKYGIYCPDHRESVNGESVNGDMKPHSSKTPCAGQVSKRTKTSAAGPSAPRRRSWSGLSTSSKRRRLASSPEEEEEENVSEVRHKIPRISTTDDSSDSGGDGLMAPIGSDESLNSVPEEPDLLTRQSPEPLPPSSEPQTPLETENHLDKNRGCEDDDKTISDAESESLLSRVMTSSRPSSSSENAQFNVAVQTIKKECEVLSLPLDHFDRPEGEDVDGPDGRDGSHGPDGPDGPHGPDGRDGSHGPDGPDGSHGPNGPDGPDGPDGRDGSHGPDGPDCSHGPDGPHGPDGRDGSHGPDGRDGSHGPNGPDGPDGPDGPVLQKSYTDYAPDPRHSSPLSVHGVPSCAASTVDRNVVTVRFSTLPLPPSPPPPNEEPSNDSAGFWRKCNAAKCTQDIFSDFIQWLHVLSSRIQAGEASQEECERALTVMKASGQLENIVAAQQKDLQRRLTELQAATAAMEEVVSALR